MDDARQQYFIEKIQVRHGRRRITGALQRMLATKRNIQTLETACREHGHTHNILGVIFELMTHYDPTLPRKSPAERIWENFLRDTIEHDPLRILDTLPPGHAPDHVWLKINPLGKTVVLDGIAEVKLHRSGISSRQLQDEYTSTLTTLRQFEKMQGKLPQKMRGRELAINEPLALWVVLPEGTDQPRYLPAPWIARNSCYSYLDVVDIGEYVTGKNIGQFLYRKQDLTRIMREQLIQDVINLYLLTARDILLAFDDLPPEHTDSAVLERIQRNLAASISMGYIIPNTQYYRDKDLVGQLLNMIHTELSMTPVTETQTLFAQALAQILKHPEDECLRFAQIAETLGGKAGNESTIIRHNPYTLLPAPVLK